MWCFFNSPSPSPSYLLRNASLSLIFFPRHLSVILDHLRDAGMFCLDALSSDPRHPAHCLPVKSVI